MRTLQPIALWVSLGLFGLAVACQSGPSTDNVSPTAPNTTIPGSSTGITYQSTPLNFTKPANFPDPVYDLAKNPLTAEGVDLGRMLFYDVTLSSNGLISCAFCHIQGSAFSHTDHPLSHGVGDKNGPRNVPAVQNVAWDNHFFWDGGIKDLDLLPIAPIENPVEMGERMPNVLARLQNSNKYPALFLAAFGSKEITSERFLKALSQFMITMVSANTKYDHYVRKEAGGDMTAQELQGLTLFKQNCATCHAGELFTDQNFRNNGLGVNPNVVPEDLGRYQVTLNEADKRKFRVPSLRNVARTQPYMHDGRFSTLEQVIKHYATGVVDNPSLDPLLKKNGQVGIPLSTQDQEAIIAFLYTLTDFSYVNDPRFGPIR
ncbi:MAG: cytochrome-c peroxidase [Spirosoma sp.]|nr:cytochrome-c peroxidase [Spirosoma sp.]